MFQALQMENSRIFKYFCALSFNAEEEEFCGIAQSAVLFLL